MFIVTEFFSTGGLHSPSSALQRSFSRFNPDIGVSAVIDHLFDDRRIWI